MSYNKTKTDPVLGQKVHEHLVSVGVPQLIKKDWIKNGAVVIDAGYHPAEKCGDMELEGIEEIASAFTPVPGGVGPMTINTLIFNTLLAAQKLA